MDCIICSLNIKFFSELSHLFLCFLLFGGHGWMMPGFHPRTIMTMLFFGFWHFSKFFDCSCSQQELPPQWQKIQILRQYACCHGFVLAQGSKMRSKKSPYLFNICRRLDFGAYCGGGDCDYFGDCREMWPGIDLCSFFDSTRNYYILSSHILVNRALWQKNKPSSEGFYNFKNEAILIQNGVIFSTIFSTNGLKIIAPIIPKKRPATISPG